MELVFETRKMCSSMTRNIYSTKISPGDIALTGITNSNINIMISSRNIILSEFKAVSGHVLIHLDFEWRR